MIVSAIKCKKCNAIIYSRAVHDFHWCPCGSVFIDGGRDYTRYGGEMNDIEVIEIEVKQTDKQLYDDWNHRIDKYGIIKEKQ